MSSFSTLVVVAALAGFLCGLGGWRLAHRRLVGPHRVRRRGHLGAPTSWLAHGVRGVVHAPAHVAYTLRPHATPPARRCTTGETVVYALPVDRDGEAVVRHLCSRGFEVVVDPCAYGAVEVLIGGPGCTREAVRSAIAEVAPPRLAAGADQVRFEDE